MGATRVSSSHVPIFRGVSTPLTRVFVNFSSKSMCSASLLPLWRYREWRTGDCLTYYRYQVYLYCPVISSFITSSISSINTALRKLPDDVLLPTSSVESLLSYPYHTCPSSLCLKTHMNFIFSLFVLLFFFYGSVPDLTINSAWCLGSSFFSSAAKWLNASGYSLQPLL